MEAVSHLVDAGRYAEALRALSLTSAARRDGSLATDALRAELLQATGADGEAIVCAQRVLRHRAVNQSLAARCHIAIAEVDRNAGRIESALDHFQSALQEAQAADDFRTQCWAQLRLLIALAEGPGLEAAVAYLPKVRRDVSRLGDRLTSVALHLYVANIESQRGLFDNAREHLRIGRSLLGKEKHCYFRSLAANSASCVAFSVADFAAAERETRRALRESARSGHAPIHRAAVTNAAHLALTRGALLSSLQLFERALKITPPSGPAQAGILDGLAQLALARGDLSAAERILGGARLWAADAPKGTWYYGLWTTVTQAKVLLRQERFAKATAVLTDAIGGASELADPFLTSVLRLLLVEAHARSRRTAAAATILADTLTAVWPSTLELLAEFGRVVGRALATAGAVGRAGIWFDRGACALASVGHRTALANLADSYADSVARARDGSAPVTPPAALLDRLPPAPTDVACRLDACTPLVPRVENDVAVAFERAAAIVAAGAFPRVVGHELMAALLESGSVTAAAVVATRAGRDRTIVEWFGVDWNAARALAAKPPRVIDVGPWQGRDFAVVVAVPTDVERLVPMLALERLAGTARFQHAARTEARERIALWPIEKETAGDGVIACSGEMLALVARARHVAAVPITVLITGETGTGKEMIARLVHSASPRVGKPFVPFNCTSVPRDLMDSQLFGHRRGAFTGATADHPGVIRAAAGGTLYLDEIGDLSLEVQPKLLRFLEASEVQPLGEPQPQKVDVRVVATTNRDLDQLVADGTFRSDLFYRLNVVPIHLPPLRERREEVPPLAEHFLERAARDFKKERLHIAAETMEYLLLYRWPGNVRQLANEMRRMAAMAEPGAVLTPEHLDPAIRAGRRTVAAAAPNLESTELVVRLDQPHAALVEHVERAQIRFALQKCDRKLDDAARLLGLSRKGLYLKRQRLGLE
jgi:DNA-binding NtrC family response regulator/tetratricopeptide (TPR) repeat protein